MIILPHIIPKNKIRNINLIDLLLFAENPSRELDRDFLVENLRGIRWQSYDRSIDVLVSRLRLKLGDTPAKTNYIKTVHGVGYMFIGEPKNKK